MRGVGYKAGELRDGMARRGAQVATSRAAAGCAAVLSPVVSRVAALAAGCASSSRRWRSARSSSLRASAGSCSSRRRRRPARGQARRSPWPRPARASTRRSSRSTSARSREARRHRRAADPGRPTLASALGARAPSTGSSSLRTASTRRARAQPAFASGGDRLRPADPRRPRDARSPAASTRGVHLHGASSIDGTDERSAAIIVGSRLRCRTGTRSLRPLLPVPADDQEQRRSSLVQRTLLFGGLALVVLLGGDRVAGHPAGRDPGAAGRRDRRAARRRAARGADGRAAARTTSPGWRVVQRDGRAACSTRSASSRSFARAAPVRLRRLARAAHPADDRPDGRRRPATTPASDFDPAAGTLGRAAADPARPVRGAARRPAGDQPVRRGRGGARRREPSTCATSSDACASRHATARGPPTASSVEVRSARRALRSPTSTRAGSSGSCATSSSTPSSTARAAPVEVTRRADGATRVAVAGARPRRRAASRGRRRWCSTGSGAPTRRGRGRRRHRPGARDRARGRPPARRLAAGVGRARARVRSFRLTLPRRAGDDLQRSPLPLVPDAGAGLDRTEGVR